MKKIIFILILLISLSGYSAEIKDGIYYVEFSEAGALTTITVAIKTIDSETKQMGYFYRYQYRITDDKVVTYVKLKKDENIFSGFSDKVFFHIKSKDNDVLEMKRKEYSEDEIIDLKYIKSIEGSDLFEVMSNLYEENSSIEDEYGHVLSLETMENIMKNHGILVRYSTDELNVIRNSIYARKGYVFKDERLRRIFESQDWYNGKYRNMNDIKLTEQEKKLIEEIKDMEWESQ